MGRTFTFRSGEDGLLSDEIGRRVEHLFGELSSQSARLLRVPMRVQRLGSRKQRLHIIHNNTLHLAYTHD